MFNPFLAHVPITYPLKTPENLFHGVLNGTKYSRMDQVKFVAGNLYKIWRSMAWFNPIQDGLFRGCPRMVGAKKASPP